MAAPNFRTLDLNLLRVFDQVMAERNLTRAARNLAILRKIAINLMGRDRTPRISMRARRKKAAWNDEYMMSLLVG